MKYQLYIYMNRTTDCYVETIECKREVGPSSLKDHLEMIGRKGYYHKTEKEIRYFPPSSIQYIMVKLTS